MKDEFEKGFGIASYLLSIAIFSVFNNNKILTIQEAIKIIDGCRTYSKDPSFFPGDSKTIISADVALQNAQDMLVRITSAKASA